MSIKDSLKKKIGPLPAWGWLAIIAIGVLAYIYFKNQSNKKAAAAQATPHDVQPPVVNQFQTTPPVQEDEDEDKKRDKDKRQSISGHGLLGGHRRRKHPTHHGDSGGGSNPPKQPPRGVRPIGVSMRPAARSGRG